MTFLIQFIDIYGQQSQNALNTSLFKKPSQFGSTLIYIFDTTTLFDL